MADLRFEYKNNQKKSSCVSATGVIATLAALNEDLFTIPEASLVTDIKVITLAGAGVGATVDVVINGTVRGNELGVSAAGVTSATPDVYLPTGGLVQVVAGATAPNTSGEIKVVVEYIETELASGTYTD